MSASRWVALHCGDETKALIEKHPNAFLLLTQIAMRAKWKDCPITGLKAGEAYIGDWRNAGLHSPKAYQVAKERLKKCQLATFQGKNKGTIATLVNSTIFSLSTEDRGKPRGEQGGRQGEAEGKPRGTNHTDTRDTPKTQSTKTPFALDGASSNPPQKITWNAENGFSGITEKDMSEWKAAFPAVALDQSLAAASRWLKDNPAKRKKLLGKFITGWLSRNQEKGGSLPSNRPSTPEMGGRTSTNSEAV